MRIQSTERPGIDDQRDRRASRRMISSILLAVSRRPLRPAFAAIASRVTSAILVPRRDASRRSLVSISSGRLTVMRFMGCQHAHCH